jgi:hypothetical protein
VVPSYRKSFQIWPLNSVLKVVRTAACVGLKPLPFIEEMLFSGLEFEQELFEIKRLSRTTRI